MPEKQTDPTETINIDSSGEPVKPSWWQLHLHWHHFSRRTKILSLVFVLALTAAIVGFVMASDGKVDAPGGGKIDAKKIIRSPLTGVPTTAALATRPVTGVMIENSQDARPQSGLNDAGVVFEAIAEGGITRFLALYQEAQPQYIGPVRSLRPYYIDWAQGYDASIAHVGGSPVALKRIRGGGKDLDQFFNAGAYWRVNYRAAPHNVYTNFKNLDKLNRSKGYKHSVFVPWARKADAPSKVPSASIINLGISGPDFNVHYEWNASANTYKRSEGGAFHASTSSANPKSAKIIRPKVVIALVVPYAIDKDGHHSDYETIGRGKLYVFQDGNVTIGTWVKKGRDQQLQLRSERGHSIPLNAGQTWVTAVDAKTDVGYK